MKNVDKALSSKLSSHLNLTLKNVAPESDIKISGISNSKQAPDSINSSNLSTGDGFVSDLLSTAMNNQKKDYFEETENSNAESLNVDKSKRDAQEVSQKESGKFQLLNKKEIAAVESYVMNAEKLNLSLIQGVLNEDQELVEFDETLSSVFKKINSHQPMVIYKGIRSALKADFLKNAKIDDIVAPPYYFSTTESKILAKDYANSYSHNILLKIYGFSGLKIEYDMLNESCQEDRGWESEVLFNKGTQFKIENICQGKKYKLIELAECSSETHAISSCSS